MFTGIRITSVKNHAIKCEIFKLIKKALRVGGPVNESTPYLIY